MINYFFNSENEQQRIEVSLKINIKTVLFLEVRMKAILFLIVHMKAIYFWKPIAHWFSKKILPRVSGLNCEHDHFVVTLVYDDEQVQAHKVICPVWSSFFNVVIVSERTVRIEELSKVHIKTILSLKVRMKAIYFWKSAWRQYISESPHEGNYF